MKNIAHVKNVVKDMVTVGSAEVTFEINGKSGLAIYRTFPLMDETGEKVLRTQTKIDIKSGKEALTDDERKEVKTQIMAMIIGGNI